MFAVLSTPRNLIARVFALLSLIVLAACEPVSMGSGQMINTTSPVPVALLVPRGGGNAGDDILAQSLENAAKLATLMTLTAFAQWLAPALSRRQ